MFCCHYGKLAQFASVVELKTIKISKFYNLRRISPLRLSPNFTRGDLFELKYLHAAKGLMYLASCWLRVGFVSLNTTNSLCWVTVTVSYRISFSVQVSFRITVKVNITF